MTTDGDRTSRIQGPFAFGESSCWSRPGPHPGGGPIAKVRCRGWICRDSGVGQAVAVGPRHDPGTDVHRLTDGPWSGRCPPSIPRRRPDCTMSAWAGRIFDSWPGTTSRGVGPFGSRADRPVRDHHTRRPLVNRTARGRSRTGRGPARGGFGVGSRNRSDVLPCPSSGEEENADCLECGRILPSHRTGVEPAWLAEPEEPESSWGECDGDGMVIVMVTGPWAWAPKGMEGRPLPRTRSAATTVRALAPRRWPGRSPSGPAARRTIRAKGVTR